jgi:hypothetical protein
MKSEASIAEIAEGALVAIHRCHTRVDIDVFMGAGLGAARIQGIAKVDIPKANSRK